MSLLKKLLGLPYPVGQITVERRLTIPREHFHADRRTHTVVHKCRQQADRRVDMMTVVVLLTYIDDFLRLQCLEPLRKRHEAAALCLDDLPGLPWQRGYLVSGLSNRATDINKGKADEEGHHEKVHSPRKECAR